MALLYSSPTNSPLPKRKRLSLKSYQHQLPESLQCFPSKDSLEDSVCHDKDSVQIAAVQDENASPNCPMVESRISLSLLIVDSDLENEVYNSNAAGLPNCGNTCYLNSVLQVLRYTPNFLNNVHTMLSSAHMLEEICPSSDEVNEIKFFHKLHWLYSLMKVQETSVSDNNFLFPAMESFLWILRESSFAFEEGEQHDAHELLLTILSKYDTFSESIKSRHSMYICQQQTPEHSDGDGAMETVQDKSITKRKRQMRKKHKLSSFARNPNIPFSGQDSSDFDLGFQGTMRHIIKCLDCETNSESSELFSNLEVSIAEDHIIEGTVDLRQCLKQRTVLSGDNKYFCEGCYQKNEALSMYDIIDPPEILLLHLSWLRQSSGITAVEKDTTNVLVPTFLKTSENREVFCCEPDQVYCLYAIVFHIGTSTEIGHYVSLVKEVSVGPKTSEPELESYQCCTSAEIHHLKAMGAFSNSWLLFDDDTVNSIHVGEYQEIFPYFKYLGNVASPCMVFYYKM